MLSWQTYRSLCFFNVLEMHLVIIQIFFFYKTSFLVFLSCLFSFFFSFLVLIFGSNIRAAPVRGWMKLRDRNRNRKEKNRETKRLLEQKDKRRRKVEKSSCKSERCGSWDIPPDCIGRRREGGFIDCRISALSLIFELSWSLEKKL